MTKHDHNLGAVQPPALKIAHTYLPPGYWDKLVIIAKRNQRTAAAEGRVAIIKHVDKEWGQR